MAKTISKTDVAEYICTNFLDMKPGQPVPGFVVRKIDEYKYYSYQVILDTFKQSKSDIEYWISVKRFNSDYQKISYIFAIIGSRIAEVERERIRTEKIMEREKQNELDFTDPVLTTGNSIEGKDISAFLEGDDV